MTKEERDSLMSLWDNEGDQPDTQEWREHLTTEEKAMVEEWDRQYDTGVGEICQDILRAEQERRDK